MPAGLEKTLTPAKLRDLIEYIRLPTVENINL